jgi:hypothetical protein
MSSAAFRPTDLENLDPSTGLTIKTIYAGTASNSDTDLGAGQPYLAVSEELLSLVGSLTNVISVSQEYGITLAGPVSVSAMPDQFVIAGGYWKINPLVLTGLPSTSVTPIPWLVPATPKLVNAASELTDALSFLTGFTDIG